MNLVYRRNSSRAGVLASILSLALLSSCAQPTDEITLRAGAINGERMKLGQQVRRALSPTNRYRLGVQAGCSVSLGYGVREQSAGLLEVELQSENGKTLATESFEIHDAADSSDAAWRDLPTLAVGDASHVLLHPPPDGVWWDVPRLACPRKDGQLNVLLVSLDTLRADRLGVYGGGKRLTPTLDAFAKGAAIFSNAYSTFPNTLGSHASLFTGYYPLQHGLVVQSGNRLPESAPTLAAHFSTAGYATAAFTENAFVSSDLGFDAGFHLYDDGPHGDGKATFPGVARETFAKGVEWLESRGAEQPFFLFLHTYEVHKPYSPSPEALAARYEAEAIPPYEGRFAESIGGLGAIVFNRRKSAFSPSELEQVERLYDAEVTVLDREVGTLLDRIDRLGLLANTIVVFVSDHGDEFNEHGYLGHGETLNEQVLRIPILVRHPEGKGAGEAMGPIVSLVDVPRTLAALAGVDGFAPGAPGRDLSAWFDTLPTDEHAPVFASLNRTDTSCESYRSGKFDTCDFGGLAVRDGNYAYIRSSAKGWERLYDMRVDRAESTDLAGELPEVLAEFRRIADEHERSAALNRLPTAAADLADETSAKLKALGYVE